MTRASGARSLDDNKSEGRLPRGDRHKAKLRRGAFCHRADLTYDPSLWRPESRRSKSESRHGERLLRVKAKRYEQRCQNAT